MKPLSEKHNNQAFVALSAFSAGTSSKRVFGKRILGLPVLYGKGMFDIKL